jgi:hypothetical protein
MKVHEFTKPENKLDLQTRNSGDRLARFEYKGLIVVRTKRSHGNKDLPENLIRQQLKVHESQFSGLISCSVSKDDYVEILKAKGLIPAPAVQQSPKLAP